MKKRWLAILLCACFVISAAACSSPAQSNDNPQTTGSAGGVAPTNVVSTPEPTPKSGLMEAFDKDKVTVALVCDTDENAAALFFEAAQQELTSMGITVIKNTSGSLSSNVSQSIQNGADAIVAYVSDSSTDKSVLEGASVPVAVFNKAGLSFGGGVSVIDYDGAAAMDMMFDAIVTFDGYDTPVRVFAMFENKETKACDKYQEMADDGYFKRQGTWYGNDSSKSAGAWAADLFDKYVAGLLEAIVVENEQLAAEAADAVSKAGRDELEVFCINSSGGIFDLMERYGEMFPEVIGANDAVAGIECARLALILLKDASVQTKSMSPQKFSVPASLTLLEALTQDEQTDFNEAFMDTLRAYYG